MDQIDDNFKINIDVNIGWIKYIDDNLKINIDVNIGWIK